MPRYTIAATVYVNNVDVAFEIRNAIQSILDRNEITGVHDFAVEGPMVECKKPPEGVAPFPANYPTL